MTRHTGRCACGAVRYETTGELRPVINCHCERCRRVTGHFMAATSTDADDVQIVDGLTLRWWAPVPDVFYGFCATCGSTLFWRTGGSQELSIAAGTLDPPTGLRTTTAWYVGSASDYHQLDHSLEERITE